MTTLTAATLRGTKVTTSTDSINDGRATSGTSTAMEPQRLRHMRATTLQRQIHVVFGKLSAQGGTSCTPPPTGQQASIDGRT
eukprot:8370580-Pyramimonas_sp.AAC.1